jgi:hypothetical protein
MTFWLKKLHLKKGRLSRQLGIPERDVIPKTLLKEIIRAKTGDVLHYQGKRIPVTELLTRRSNLALTLKRMRK